MTGLYKRMLEDAKRLQEEVGPAPGHEAYLLSVEDEKQLREKVEHFTPPEMGGCLGALAGVQIFTHKYMRTGNGLGGTVKQIAKIVEYLDYCQSQEGADLLLNLFKEAGEREQA
jgi:hypothetical protein